jgi:phosphatidylglycerophosphatase A
MEPNLSASDKRTWRDWLVLAAGTGFFVGLIPPRTATIATLWGIPLAIGLHYLVGWTGYLPMLAALWLVGIPICRRSAELLGGEDPRAVAYDEVVTLPIVYFLVPSFSWQVLITGFVLHRMFDIAKPLGIRRLERLGGGLGIMSDDLLAAGYALVVMRLLRYGELWPFR